jgi:hypothetical protein
MRTAADRVERRADHTRCRAPVAMIWSAPPRRTCRFEVPAAWRNGTRLRAARVILFTVPPAAPPRRERGARGRRLPHVRHRRRDPRHPGRDLDGLDEGDEISGGSWSQGRPVIAGSPRNELSLAPPSSSAHRGVRTGPCGMPPRSDERATPRVLAQQRDPAAAYGSPTSERATVEQSGVGA